MKNIVVTILAVILAMAILIGALKAVSMAGDYGLATNNVKVQFSEPDRELIRDLAKALREGNQCQKSP